MHLQTNSSMYNFRQATLVRSETVNGQFIPTVYYTIAITSQMKETSCLEFAHLPHFVTGHCLLLVYFLT